MLASKVHAHIDHDSAATLTLEKAARWGESEEGEAQVPAEHEVPDNNIIIPSFAKIDKIEKYNQFLFFRTQSLPF